MGLVLEVIGVVAIILAVVVIGRPVAEMISRKVTYKLDSLGSDAEQQLRAKVAALEEEVRSLRVQMIEMKETTEFAVKMLEQSKESGEKLEIKSSEKHLQ